MTNCTLTLVYLQDTFGPAVQVGMKTTSVCVELLITRRHTYSVVLMPLMSFIFTFIYFALYLFTLHIQVSVLKFLSDRQHNLIAVLLIK